MSVKKIIPEKDLEHLGNLLSYLMVLREKRKPVTHLHRTVGDIRRLIQKIIKNTYLHLNKKNESLFIGEIIDFLCDIKEDLSEFDEEFCDYCIGKVILSFEKAVKIKEWTNKSPAQEELLSTLPILDRFDFKLKNHIQLLSN